MSHFEAPNRSRSVLIGHDPAVLLAAHGRKVGIFLAACFFTAAAVAQTAPKAATPVLNPSTAKWTTPQQVSITDATAGSTIYYTLDGSTPTTLSPVYSSPLTISADTTVTAVANAPGYSLSSTKQGVYYYLAQAPTFTPSSGSYVGTTQVALSSTTPSATIYYTLDGSSPTTSSSVYTGPISVAQNTTVKAMAAGGAGYSLSSIVTANYSIMLSAPVFSPNPTKYTSVQTVSITDSASGAAIYYTLDGTQPTTSSAVYQGPLTVSSNTTLKAMAGNIAGYSTSKTTTGTYTIALPSATPSISPAGGNYTSSQTITLADSTQGTTIYYTTNGKAPSTSSTVYTGPFSVSGNTTVEVMACTPTGSASPTATAVYNISAPAPVISPGSGTFYSAQSISITESLPGATIHYTLDGSVPSYSSPTYSQPISFAPTTTTTKQVQAIAYVNGYTASPVSTVTMTVTLPPGVIATTQVSGAAGLTVPADFLGISYEWGGAQTLLGSVETGLNAPLRTLLQNLISYGNGPLVFRVGGNSTDSTGAPGTQWLTPLTELAQSLPVHYILGVNLGSDNLGLAESQAAAYASQVPDIDAFEIGNEPDDYPTNGDRTSSYGYPQFISEFQTWQNGISASTPANTGIAGPAFAGGAWENNAKSDLASGALNPSIVTQHYYIACYNPSSPLASDLLLQPNSSIGGPWGYKAYVAAAHQVNKLFRMGEMNSVCSGGQPGLSNSFSSALWGIDTMFEYANAGFDGVNFHTGNGNPYALFSFNLQKTGGTTNFTLTGVTPLYYGMLFFAQATGYSSQLIPLATMTDSNIKVWATVDSNNVTHVIVINKDLNASGTVQITVPGYSTAKLLRLSAPSYQSQTGLTFGGQTFDGSPDGTLQGTLTPENVTGSGGTFSINVSPISAVMVNITQ